MNIPKELIKEIINGHTIIDTSKPYPYVLDTPLDVEVLVSNGKMVDDKLMAIIPQREFGIICEKEAYMNSMVVVRTPLEKESKPMTQQEMCNYCFNESLKEDKVLFVKYGSGRVYPFWTASFDNPVESYSLTWDCKTFFKFPSVKLDERSE